MVDTRLTRRRSIVLGGTALSAAVAGLALGTDRAGAQADVELGSIDTQDEYRLTPDDGEAWAPFLQIRGPYSYRVEADPAEWQVYLLIGDGSGNTTAVGMTSGEATARQGSGTYALQGAVTAADAWGPSDFAVAADGSPTTVDVPIEVILVVRDADNGMLVQAGVEATVPITVEQGGTTANLGAAVDVVLMDDADDPTPTPPEV